MSKNQVPAEQPQSQSHPLDDEYKALELRKLKAEVAQAELDLQGTRRFNRESRWDHQRERASDFNHRVHRLSGMVDRRSVDECMADLAAWSRIDPGCDLTVVLCSGGGDAYAGLALYNELRYLSRQGHTITTLCQGWAASAAGVILQGGDVRLMDSESVLMLHEPSTMAFGTTSQIEDDLSSLKLLTNQVASIFAGRSDLTKKEVIAGLKRRDWWLSPKDALGVGFIDAIR